MPATPTAAPPSVSAMVNMVRRVVYAGIGGWIGGLRGRSSRGYWQAEQEVLSAALIAPQCGQKQASIFSSKHIFPNP